MASMELEGMDNLMRKIEDMGKTGTSIENVALKKAGEAILAEIKARAPRSSSPRQPKGKTQMWRTGGHAADILSISGIKNKGGRKYILAGIQKGDNSKAFYLKFKEFGRSNQDKEPFMGPAYESKKEELKEIIRQELKRGLGL